ncbi:MAG: ABC transporter permease subunit [Azospirillaceae bacterium]
MRGGEIAVARVARNPAGPARAALDAARRLRRRWRPLARRVVLGGLGVVVVLGLWTLAGMAVGRYLPPPWTVVANLLDHFFASDYLRGLGLPAGGYIDHVWATTGKVVVGMVVGTLVGGTLALAAAHIRWIGEAFAPLVAALGTLPILALAPFFLIWFGISAVSQIVLVSLYTVTIIYIYSLRAVRNIDARYGDYARTLGAPRRLVFHRVSLPAALPEMFGGIRIAFAASWGLTAIAELLGAQSGAGRAILSLSAVYDVTGMMAVILLLGIVALIMDGLIVMAKAWLTRWSAVGAGSSGGSS